MEGFKEKAGNMEQKLQVKLVNVEKKVVQQVEIFEKKLEETINDLSKIFLNYNCDYCGKSFTESESLETHIKMIHGKLLLGQNHE